MKQRLKSTYRKRLIEIFAQIRNHPWHIRLMQLPFWVRMLLALPLLCVGLIALVTPIPAGWVMILTACVLIFGVHLVQRYSIRLLFSLQIHHLMDRLMRWWRSRSR